MIPTLTELESSSSFSCDRGTGAFPRMHRQKPRPNQTVVKWGQDIIFWLKKCNHVDQFLLEICLSMTSKKYSVHIRLHRSFFNATVQIIWIQFAFLCFTVSNNQTVTGRKTDGFLLLLWSFLKLTQTVDIVVRLVATPFSVSLSEGQIIKHVHW